MHKILIAIAFLMASVLIIPASAATVTYTGPAGLAFLELPKFDPILGTLTAVELSLFGGGDIFGQAINPDPSLIGGISVSGFSGFGVSGFFAAIFAGTEDVFFPFTGAIPPDPVFEPSAPFSIPLSGSGGIVLTDGASLSDFTATFLGDDYSFHFAVLAPIVDAGGAATSIFGSSVGGDLSVAYTFTVVPEPTTFGTSMLLTSAGVIGGSARRKRDRPAAASGV